MRIRNLFVCTAIFTAALATASASFAQAPAAKPVDNTDPRTARIGVWDNTTNPNNVMTYEASRRAAASSLSATRAIRRRIGAT